eukprot:SAG31_NODE_1911_length_6936_cov_124.794501_5_plen_91_part_00
MCASPDLRRDVNLVQLYRIYNRKWLAAASAEALRSAALGDRISGQPRQHVIRSVRPWHPISAPGLRSEGVAEAAVGLRDLSCRSRCFADG